MISCKCSVLLEIKFVYQTPFERIVKLLISVIVLYPWQHIVSPVNSSSTDFIITPFCPKYRFIVPKYPFETLITFLTIFQIATLCFSVSISFIDGMCYHRNVAFPFRIFKMRWTLSSLMPSLVPDCLTKFQDISLYLSMLFLGWRSLLMLLHCRNVAHERPERFDPIQTDSYPINCQSRRWVSFSYFELHSKNVSLLKA